jgi:hypothetical protein
MRGMNLCCLAAGLLLLSGCSPSEPTVTGVVQVDGELLANGSIRFVPVDGKGAVAGDHGPGGGATIREGKYRIEKGLTVGRYRVEIQATRRIPGKPILDPVFRDELLDDEVPVVPPQYNKKSTLIREVKAGSQEIDFPDLKGIKKSQ